MTTITRERLEWLSKISSRDEIDDIGGDEIRELARIALASLTAEPVAWIWKTASGHDTTGVRMPRNRPGKYAARPLYAAPPALQERRRADNAEPVAITDDMAYAFHRALSDSSLGADEVEEIKAGLRAAFSNVTAPPAPVVPDEKTDRDYVTDCHGVPSLEDCAHQRGWNACRAAMLHGKADTELQRKAAIHDALCEKYNVESLADFIDWQRNHIAELEAAPPARVGEGESAVMPDYPGCTMTQRECFDAGKKAGLAEAGNSPVIPDCWCRTCRPITLTDMRFVVCPECGNKRCPHANDHRNACTGSNEHGQVGSAYPAAPQQEVK